MLIDVSRLEELLNLKTSRDEHRIGTAVTHATIEDQADGKVTMRCLASVVSMIGHRSVRNRGTIGGSMAESRAGVLFDPERNVTRLFVGALSDAPRQLSALAHAVAVQGAVSRKIIAMHIKEALPSDDAIHTRRMVGVIKRALRQMVS